MNRNLDEKEIERLFGELGAEDDRHAPLFARVLRAALARAEKPSRPWLLIRVAAAVAAVVVLAVSLFVFITKSKRADLTATNPPVIDTQEQQPNPSAMPPRPEPPPRRPATPSNDTASRKPVRKHAAGRVEQSEVLISQWRSPTDFLLRTPGDQLLKTVPRLGESSIRIGRIPPSDMN